MRTPARFAHHGRNDASPAGPARQGSPRYVGIVCGAPSLTAGCARVRAGRRRARRRNSDLSDDGPLHHRSRLVAGRRWPDNGTAPAWHCPGVAAEFQYEWDVRRLSGCKRSRFVRGDPKAAATLVAHAERGLTVASSGRRTESAVCLFCCFAFHRPAVRTEPPLPHWSAAGQLCRVPRRAAAALDLAPAARAQPMPASACVERRGALRCVGCSKHSVPCARPCLAFAGHRRTQNPWVISASTGARLCVAPNLRQSIAWNPPGVGGSVEGRDELGSRDDPWPSRRSCGARRAREQNRCNHPSHPARAINAGLVFPDSSGLAASISA
jgi:hypothetical protein